MFTSNNTMDSYIFVDSVQRTSGVSNSYVYRLKKVLKGVHEAELLSAAFPQLSSCTHVILDVSEFETPRNDGNFAIINNLVPINSNIAYTSQSFYKIQEKFDNPFDVDRLTINWKDPTGNLISMGNNSLLFKISHLK